MQRKETLLLGLGSMKFQTKLCADVSGSLGICDL